MPSKVKAQRSATAEAPAATLETTLPAPTRPAYLMEKLDDTTGELVSVSRFRYLPGHPRQVRFDAKAGQFNIGGTVPLGPALSFIPLAWRIFQDDILNMGRKLWAELFYADEKGAVCAVLFHGYSVENLYRLIEPLFYDDLTLADVVVKVQASKKETTKDGKKATYYIAEFSYEPAPADEVAARRDYARDLPIWRAETYTGAADTRIQHGYTVPDQGDDPHTPAAGVAELPAA
ncbi:hypothetical protein EJV47_23740 [Hymenobacter gummosus]|uniref:Uncharacterized protein n=1 Tax=Hymenobacter gummosus TaxID=1776032 RepID=A0A3S0JAV5_9BACT|nr:hypothetical protein [Hymenobacter gummosus]RTQ45845.1 hypothetical protein EJV47_23740 [Hymenobacter gummosus]